MHNRLLLAFSEKVATDFTTLYPSVTPKRDLFPLELNLIPLFLQQESSPTRRLEFWRCKSFRNQIVDEPSILSAPLRASLRQPQGSGSAASISNSNQRAEYQSLRPLDRTRVIALRDEILEQRHEWLLKSCASRGG